jgi:hypothetical protein
LTVDASENNRYAEQNDRNDELCQLLPILLSSVLLWGRVTFFHKSCPKFDASGGQKTKLLRFLYLYNWPFV